MLLLFATTYFLSGCCDMAVLCVCAGVDVCFVDPPAPE